MYNLGCVNCNEPAYIKEQEQLTALKDGECAEDDEPDHQCFEDTCVCTDGMCGDSEDEDL